MNVVKNHLPPLEGERLVILVAAYGDLTSARQDFAELAAQVKQERLHVREAVLVGKNNDGTNTVLAMSCGHHGRSGAVMGAGIGVLIGWFVPPVAMAIAVGTVVGAAVANFADHELKAGLRHEIAESLAAGTGVVVAVVGPANEPWVQRTLKGASTHAVAPFGESTIASLDNMVAEAMNAVSPADAS
jgi:uncharacterized membrane protein